MNELFRIESEHVRVRWCGNPPRSLPHPGRHVAEPGRLDLWATGDVPKTTTHGAEPPRLFENTTYDLTVEARDPNGHVEVSHRDPKVTSGLLHRAGRRVVAGVLSFGSNVGLSRFDISLNGRRVLSFTVKVFPGLPCLRGRGFSPSPHRPRHAASGTPDRPSPAA